ncbi:MAG: FeoB-associated Cys-rich membrane protein [bacterium]|nr:FeoB-associated Cys-rich membrane protein [bacterium]
MGTVAVGIGVAAIVIGIIVKMVKDKKQGKSIQCGCNCKDCGGHCH